MDTHESRSYYQGDVFGQHEESGIKHRLGRLGRRIKHVDLRSQIVEHPFTAVGIALGAGALLGLLRPMPQRGRVSGALVAAMTAIGFRLVREAAVVQLGQYARDLLWQDDAQRRQQAQSRSQSQSQQQPPQQPRSRY